MNIPSYSAIAIAAAAVSCGPPRTARETRPSIAAEQNASVDELVRVRCAHDGRDVITTWRGSVYAFVPGEAQKTLFTVIGMNIARCLRDQQGWFMTSRELMYYLDPSSGAVLHRWTNPWTGEAVPVMHVANALVQARLRGDVPMHVAGGFATITIDVPLYYPNRLAALDTVKRYSPEDHYQAGEFFSLTADAAAVMDVAQAAVPQLVLGWFRISPWLPWMNMGDRPGRLVFSARGHKVASIADLRSVLRDEIERRLPLYRQAPRCFVDGVNETSWSYFAAHVDDYLAGARFPLAEPPRPRECAIAPATLAPR